ncbi:hypothetical protein F4V58_10760 [Corynebacterium phocae]|nr:hypothetical protein F4V58_10760 [Corynebacterium phocae]
MFIDTGVQFKVIFRWGSRFTPLEREWLDALGAQLSPIEEDILVSLHRGEKYSRARLHQEYAPYSEANLDRVIAGLTRRKLIIVRHEEFFLEQPTKESAAAAAVDFQSLGKNVPAVAAVVQSAGRATIKELTRRTGLSVGQVRYALTPLLEHSLVAMEGGQGTKVTSYAWEN